MSFYTGWAKSGRLKRLESPVPGQEQDHNPKFGIVDRAVQLLTYLLYSSRAVHICRTSSLIYFLGYTSFLSIRATYARVSSFTRGTV